MSEAAKYVPRLIEDRLAELHTIMLCKVLSFNQTNHTADIQPLNMIKFKNTDNPQVRPPLLEVPCMKRKTMTLDAYDNPVINVDSPYYSVGDIVVVVFSERAIDTVLSGDIADSVYSRKHALEDAIIIGLI
jgi:hypothetical protein